MKYLKNLAAGFLLLFVAGCAGGHIPETSYQRLAYAETQYAAVVEALIELKDQGIIPDEKDEVIIAAIMAARGSLTLWQEFPDSDERQDAALAALRVVQTILNMIRETLTKPLVVPLPGQQV